MADLVNTGYLPEEAYYYKEPPGPFRHVVNFKEGSYVVFTAQTNSVEDLKVIGRRVIKDGKEEIVFDPVINLDVGNALRDKLRQIPVQSK